MTSNGSDSKIFTIVSKTGHCKKNRFKFQAPLAAIHNNVASKSSTFPRVVHLADEKLWCLGDASKCTLCHRPQTIVELGAGRSSYYRGEYALKKGTQYITFEQHFYYYLKLKRELQASFLPTHYVRHAPIRDDWYDTKIVKHSLQDITAIEFLFCNWPATPSAGDRASNDFYQIILPYLGEIKKRFSLIRYNFHSDSDDTYLSLVFSPSTNALPMETLPQYIKSRFMKV